MALVRAASERELQKEAAKYLVGGVSCGWNDQNEIGSTHFARAEGAHVWDVEGKEYIDFNMGWGSLFLGHNPEIYREIFAEAFNMGLGMVYETEYHVKLAKFLTEIMPSAEKVRFTNTGTESTMFAIKQARAYTGKEKIIKFEGHFHGVNDYLNFANDAYDRLGNRNDDGTIEVLPGSTGIPKAMSEYVIALQYNDFDSFMKIVENNDDIAGVIVEPICLASVVMFPQNGFLEKLREECTKRDIVLIFDEVMVGFRERIGGAQAYLGVQADLTTISKIMGCGFVISGIVGKEKYMNVLDPVGECVASGTNIGRLLSVIGSYKALSYLRDHTELYEKNNANADYFIKNINEIGARRNVPVIAKGFGGRTVIHFGVDKVNDNYENVVNTWNKDYHYKCFQKAYEKGLYSFLMPLAICPEPITITPAHDRADIDKALEIFDDIIKNTEYKEKKN